MIPFEHTSDSRVIIETESMWEFLARVKTSWNKKHYVSFSQRPSSKCWTLFHTYEEWDDVVLRGADSPLVRQLLGRVSKEMRTLRKLFYCHEGRSPVLRDSWGLDGFAVDVGRFLEGEPECFFATNSPTNELIDLYITNDIHASVDATQKALETARIAKLIYLLQLKGCNTRIYCCTSATYGAAKYKLKDYHDVLDLRNLLINLLPDFQRRYMFQLYELDPAIDDSYGCTIDSMWNIWRDKFSGNALTIDLLKADYVGISESLLKRVAKERDIRTVVKKVNATVLT